MNSDGRVDLARYSQPHRRRRGFSSAHKTPIAGRELDVTTFARSTQKANLGILGPVKSRQRDWDVTLEVVEVRSGDAGAPHPVHGRRESANVGGCGRSAVDCNKP